MNIYFLTLTPEMIEGALKEGIIQRAIKNNFFKIKIINFRDFSVDKHNIVDDVPYSGGEGMLLKPEPIIRAVESIPKSPRTKIIIPTPRGQKLTNKLSRNISEKFDSLIFICGRYEGIDERVFDILKPLEISIGNYIISNGELSSLVIFNSVVRFLDGVVQNPDSITKDSFENDAIKYPQYTRPDEYRGFKVPKVLLSGNHKLIKEWQKKKLIYYKK